MHLIAKETGVIIFTILQGAYMVDDNTQEITVIQDRAKTACRSQQALSEMECVFMILPLRSGSKKNTS